MNCFSSTLWAAAVVLTSGGPLAGAEPRVPQQVEQLMQGRQYEQALQAIAEATGNPDFDADYLAYLKGRALHLQQKYDEAAAAFELVATLHPQSVWARRAQLAKAVSLARKGDYRSAELLYREAAERLLSPERRQEVADIYLEFANALFKPEREEDEPNYEKARQFFQRALEVKPREPTRIEVELRIAQCTDELGQKPQAAQQYRQFIKQHPDHPLVVEARFRLGAALIASNRVQARRAWQDLLQLHGESSSPRLPEAAFRLSETYGLPAPGNQEELDLGVASLKSFLKSYPDDERVGKAHLRIGQSLFHVGRFDDCVQALGALIADERFAAADETAEARQLQGHAQQRQGKFDEALKVWREYLVQHPTHKAWSQVQLQIVNTEFLKAQAAYDKKQYAEARKLWQEFLARYPLDQRAPTVLYRFGEMSFAQEQWDEAIADWRRLVSKYPGSEQASTGQLMIGRTLEERLGKFEEALAEYRKLDWGEAQRHAQRRIARLTAKSMRIRTTRVFRSDENPSVQLVARNLEKLSVRVYSVDLETYFRKMHLASGVEALDVALIDPDRSFEFEVPGYEPYKRIECDIETPLPNADHQGGVMAVTVSSDKLEATTLVIRSDLDILTKCSREEAFVFAENMRSGEPWEGARVLISDGARIITEGATGKDGVFRQSLQKLASSDDIRVFAVAGQHTASDQAMLAGLEAARGLTPKGYIYTDRFAYRPGQLVHIRGVIRHVDGDTYVVREGKKYQVEAIDTRERLLFQTEVALDRFGAFHTHLQLPSEGPLGQCRIRVHDQDQENYDGGFQVQSFRLEPVRIEIDTPRNTYYRGEVIEGVVRVSYYYGAPVAGREVRYQLTGQQTHTATTNDQGEVPFKLETRGFRESQVLQLTAMLPERNLAAGRNLHLATQGFTLSASTVRSTFLSGESLEVTIKAADPEGQPVARDVSLRVYRRETVGDETLEVQVDEETLKTDEADGVVRHTLTLEKGGTHILRVEGTDRFENPVSAETEVLISDDSDNVRLRILADRHTFKAGETAKIRLHWREQPALALVAFQAARILDYQLVPLRQGENVLEAPMTAQLAPNFQLSVDVMTDQRQPRTKDGSLQRLHSASAPFTVQRELKVKLDVADAQQARPGEPVKVIVTTTDMQGRPLPASVSLALVEQSLLDRYPSPLSAIGAFFRGADRQPAVRTQSSATFSYDPATKAIDRRLLAEEDRLAVEAEEERRLAEFEGAQRPFVTSIIPVIDSEPADPFADSSAANASARGMNPFGAPTVPGLRASNAAMGGSFGGGGPGGQMGEAAPAQQQAESPFPTNRSQVVDGSSLTLRASVRTTASVGSLGGGLGGFGSGQQDNAYYDVGQAFEQFVDAPGVSFAKITQMQVINEQGQYFALGSVDAKQLEQLAAQPGTRLLRMPQETGYWNPAVVTDEQGRATLTITLPQRSTSWSLQCKGVTVETLAGEDQQPLVASKPLFGQLKIPAALTDGDHFQVVASIHNDLLEEGEIQVQLKTTLGEKSTTVRRTLTVRQKGIEETVFEQQLQLPEAWAWASTADNMAVELTVSAGEISDVVAETIQVRPDGVPLFSIESGEAEGDALAVLDTPAKAAPQSRQLQVIVGPTVERSLLDVVLAPAPHWCARDNRRLAAPGESAASDLMAALALQQLVAASRDEAAGPAGELDARIRSTLSRLISQQRDDGGWSWAGGEADAQATARATWALSLAARAGYRAAAAPRDKAVQFVHTLINKAPNADYETRSLLLHALAAAGRGDFPLANQLYRNRQALTPAAIGYLALAFVEMDRQQTAAEIIDLMADDPPRQSQVSAVELHALHALVLHKTAPAGDQLAARIDWLMNHRIGNRWAPDKATGPAMLALCQWYARTKFAGEKYQLQVYVNDHLAETLQVDSGSRTQTVDVPGELLGDGQQRVRFVLQGRGRYTYQCVLSGFVASADVAGTTARWQVTRYCEPAPLEVDGRSVPRGFDIVAGRFEPFRNKLTELPVARRGRVELRVRRDEAAAQQADREYLVVREPIPAGATVVEQSIHGGFERFELAPGEIVFHLGSQASFAPITYEFHGYVPGQYRAPPTLVQDAFRPDQLATAVVEQLQVLPIGAVSSDPYRLSPRELLELGTRHYRRKEYAEAGKHLTQLFDQWSLKDDAYKDAVSMLLDVHLETDRPADVVRYFEIIIEKYPDLAIAFEKYLKIGDAYHKLSEYERSYLVFRAVVERSFRRESSVAGVVQQEGEFLRGAELLEETLRQYPPEPYIASATYALAQDIYAKAPEAAADPKLREAKVTRVDLIRRAARKLEGFLAAHPDDPAADEASFSLANAYLDLEQFDLAIQRCDDYARRYPESEYLDSYWYVIGYCHYAQGRHEQALEMCRRVSEARRQDPRSGRVVESPNKWRAIYILGQIYHSLNQAEQAIREYTRVQDRFVDARQAIQYFTRQAIELPEVVSVRPGQEAAVQLKHRNIATCRTTVYRIDLMKFSLLRRDLDGFTQINLAGIRPYHELTTQLGDGKDYRDRATVLGLPLKEEGAYLVVCRGDDLHASGLVLVTPLELEVQEEQESGRVRATVRDTVQQQYLNDVHVKVIGGYNADFVSGETDLRGIFVADGIRGRSMVIAEASGGRYAFYRGQTQLGPPPQLPQPQASQPGAASTVDPRNARAYQALEQTAQLRFNNMPLEQVVENLASTYNVPIILDRRAMDDAAIGSDTPVKMNLRGVSLGAGLKLMLRDLDLTYIIRDEVVQITTQEVANELGQAAPAAPASEASGDLLEGLKGGNRRIQQERQKQLEDLYKGGMGGFGGGGFGGGGMF